jgi:two-component system OmpR family response regulator
VRVLLVEDETALADQLASALDVSGYAVDRADDGMRAEFLGSTEHYDAVVLDLGLPSMDGLTLLRRWRDSGVTAPVLVLTARGTWHEKVLGIDSGADDYVSKPFRWKKCSPGFAH